MDKKPAETSNPLVVAVDQAAALAEKAQTPDTVVAAGQAAVQLAMSVRM